MKVLALLFVTALIASSFATSDEEVLKTLQKMENSKFGKTILDTIALQLSTSDQVEDLIKLLQGIEKKLADQQAEDDAFISRYQAQCDETLQKLEFEIEEAKQKAKQLLDEINEKTPIRDAKQKEVNDKYEFRTLLQDKLIDLENRKVLKDEEWAREQEEHDKATYVIEKAKQVISSALNAAFLQKDAKMSKAAFAELSDHFANSAKKQKFTRQSWSALFNVLASITASAPVQADQDAVKQVIDLCQQLLDKIAESREIERRDYQHWIEEYERTKNEVNEKLNVLNQEITNLEQEIAALTKRIQAATYERNEQLERIKQKSAQHDEQLRLCNDENVSYSKRRQARMDDREVVSDAIALLQSNLRLFRKYVQDRLKNVVKAK